MTSIFNLTRNSKGFEKLRQIKDELQHDREEIEEKERKHIEEVHRKKHVFDSYEQALDWAIKTKNGISWHDKTLFWESDKNKFKSYEQEFDLDGVIPTNVIYYYTKEQLLESIKEHIEWYNKKYPEQAYLEWWLDKYGKLKYVYII